MRFSTKVRYGLRICFLVGADGGVVSLSSLVSRTKLSEKYLEKILSNLKKGGVLLSRRGAGGGYSLAMQAEEITLKQILRALGEDFAVTDCASGDCEDDCCPNRLVMKRIYKSVDDILSTTTLRDMIDEHRCSCFDILE